MKHIKHQLSNIHESMVNKNDEVLCFLKDLLLPQLINRLFLHENVYLITCDVLYQE